jgi:hypothetical protein
MVSITGVAPDAASRPLALRIAVGGDRGALTLDLHDGSCPLADEGAPSAGRDARDPQNRLDALPNPAQP